MGIMSRVGHWGDRLSKLLLVAVAAIGIAPLATAQTAPFWNGGSPNNVNNPTAGTAILPAAWPSQAQWVPYSWGTTFPDATIGDKHPVRDQRVQDPSNGGTTPQNYVNVSSGCGDQTLPSIYYYFDPVSRIIFFRWRVEQIPNTYATGSSLGAYSTSDPWKSALWTVFMDLNGDGYRDFAMHLDGSSGSPSAPIDILRSIWSPLKSNSIDYLGASADIHSLFTNPTAFVDNTSQHILQFSGIGAPTTIQWPNGSSETTWDYGTTRSINISTSSCVEYYVDYQIPLAMLNSTAYTGGRQLDEFTPFQFLFTTANSLNNPFQKDVVWEGNFVCDATSPGPFGDALTLSGGIIPQPISTSITAGSPASCVVPLVAQIMDALTVTNCASTSELVSAQFKYYYDINGDGLDNDGGSWINIGEPSVPIGTTVKADWNTQNLIQGTYLIALEITDNRNHTTQTWAGKASAPLTQPFGTDVLNSVTRNLYTNVPPFSISYPYSGLSAQSYGISYTKVTVGGLCGTIPPTVTKTNNANPAGIQQGTAVTYTLNFTNTSNTNVSVSSITDTLPTGFAWVSNGGGTLGTPSSTTPATGTVTWTFPSGTFPSGTWLPANSTRTFVFTANAGTSGGTFFNNASIVTNVGTLTAVDTVGVVVKTASLTITKGVALASAPGTPVTVVNRGDTVRFSFVVTNNSQTNVTFVRITDPLPPGFTFVSATNSPQSTPSVGSNGSVVWGSIVSNLISLNGCTGNPCTGGGVFSATIDAVATVSGPATNIVTADSLQAAQVSATASLSVNGPLLAINKTASTSRIVAQVNPNTVLIDYVIQYANIGNATATGVTLTDVIPAAGFTLQIGANTTTGCTQAGTTISCNATAVPTTLAAGATGFVNLRFAVGSTAVSPAVNTATVSGTGIPSAQAQFTVTIDPNACTSTTYFFRSTTGAVSTGANGYGVGYVNMTNNGANYTTLGTMSFTGGAGSGAAGTVIGGAGNGQILGVNVTNPGSGYASGAPPTVAFAGGNGTGAAGTAVLTASQFLALTAAGSTNTTSATQTVGTLRELFRFYSDPVDSTTAYLISSASETTGWTVVSNGTKLEYTAVLADFNPITNAQTTIATVVSPSINNGTNISDTRTFTLTAPGYVLPAGHRLVWIFSANDSNNNHSTQLQFLYNGAAAPFNSSGTVCMQPVHMSLTKHADKLVINPGADLLTYTLQYANPSPAAFGGVVVTDPLPTGMTYLSSTVSSGSIGVVGNNVTWTVGSVASGGTGTATITVQTTSGITGTSVTNNATLSSTPGPDVTASTTTTIARPDVRIAKRASGNNFVPGQSFTYTVDVVNAGNGIANGVVMTDTLPSYINATGTTASTTNVRSITVLTGGSGYTSAPNVAITGTGTGATANAVITGGVITAIVVTNPGTGYTATPSVAITGGGGTGATASATLRTVVISNPTVTYNIGSMTAGTTVSITISVTISTSGVPSGVNQAINTASVVDSYDPTPRTATAIVTITATPALTFSQTATPSASRVVFVNVTAGGSYTSPPTASVTGCTTPPTLEVSTTPSAGLTSTTYSVTGVTVISPGAGCLSPVVSFSTGSGSGATAIATTGPAPGDTITYVLTLTSTGNADATGCSITGTVPPNTTYTSGGTFNLGTVTSNIGTIAPGNTGQLTYVVTVNSTLPYSYSSPFGVTALPQSGSAASTNVVVSTTTSSTFNTGTSPRYTITDTPDGDVVAYPLTTLANPAANTSSITVSSGTLISVGDYIATFNAGVYTTAQVTGKSGNNITLSSPVTASAGSNIVPVELYSLAYGNIGGASGSGVTVSDTLPGGLLYAGTPLSTVASATVVSGGTYATAPTVLISGGGGTGATATAIIDGAGHVTGILITNPGSGYSSNPTISFSGGGGTGAVATAALADPVPNSTSGAIVWNIGNLANGTSGVVKFLAIPTAAGSYTNVAVISDGSALNDRNAYDNATTTFGALTPFKSTTTPNVLSGTGVARYIITVQNPLPSTTATSVVVTDNLPAGFTYKNGTTLINGGAGADPCSSCATPAWSGTSLNIAAGGTLTIQFDANVGSSVPNGTYDNEILVSSSIPSLVFDYLATTAEDVSVCSTAPPINAPAACAGSANNVASIAFRPQATYTWSINNGALITNSSITTVNTITIGNGGTGYLAAPTISFTGGGGGTGATATATVSAGVITAITVTNPGSGYTSTPTVVVTPTSGGTGASAAVVLGTGILYTAGSTSPTISVTITEGSCSVSNSTSVTINGAFITAQPQSKTICIPPNQNVVFSVTATNASTYQWQIDTGAGFNNVSTGSGGTTASYTFPAVAGSNGNKFRVIITGNGGCSVTSNTATLTVSCAPDLEMTTDSDAPDPIVAGQNITYTQLFTNIAQNATNQTITLTETVPAGTTFVSFAVPANFSCTGVPAVGGTGTFSCTSNTSIAAGGTSGSFAFVVKTDAATADGATINDAVSVSTPNDTNTNNNANSAATTVIRRIDIQTAMTDNAFNSVYGAHFIYPGNPATPQPLTWSVTVANAGVLTASSSQATNVVLTDTMPFGFTYSSSNISGSGNSCSFNSSQNTLTCTIPTLNPTPAITFSGGGAGSGAAAVATVVGGVVTGITITNGGSGYTSAPVLTISTAGSGSGATATAILTNGVVTGYTINNGGSGYTSTPVINIIGQTTVDTIQIPNDATMTYNETDTNKANDPSNDQVTVLAVTVVKMLTMDATQSKTGVTITWKTSYEQDNLGFYVWRQVPDGTRQKIDNHIINGSALFTGRKITDGRSYRVNDKNVPANTFVQYYIEDVDLKGVHTMHGPVTPRVVSSNATNSGTTTDPDPSAGSVGGIFTTAPGMGITPPPATAPDAQRLAQQWKIAATSAAKVIVTQPGWYKVTKSDLLAAGFDPGNSSSRISVFADGIEVPIVISSGTFGANDAIEFYGTALDTPTAGGHTYYVTNGVGAGLRVQSAKSGGGGAAAPASYPYAFSRIERTLYFAALTNNGDRENFFGAIVSTWPASETLTVSNLDPNGGDAKLNLIIQGANDANYQHIVSVTLNGRELGPIQIHGQSRSVNSFNVPLSLLTAGENTLTFTAIGGDDDTSTVESAVITYPHLYRADSNALALTLPAATSATASGFTSSSIRVVDLTNPQAPVQLPVTITTAGDGTKGAAFVTSPDSGTHTLLAFGDDRVLAPAQIVMNAVSKLNAPTNSADLVIITHRDFLSAATTLKAARDAQGIATTIVDVQNIYDEFSYGAHGPAAIRAFLQRASTSWTKAPKYVLLLGDASFDPRNYLGIASVDFVPTKLIPTAYLKTASDDWLADFNDTDTPAMAIGRLPVRTADEAAGIVAKLVRRSTPPTDSWARSVEIVTDVPGNVPFDKGGDQLAALVPTTMTTGRIAFDKTPNPGSAVIDAFNTGSVLTNYVGHGSIEIWSDYVFDSTMASALTNSDKLPFVVTMNCLNGYFHDLFSESLGEALLKNANGGAIGVWASSALTSPDQQLLVNLDFNRQVLGAGSPAIGDAILHAKRATMDRDVRRTWILLGDPTMKLRR
jgi:uncharacterized repeat protein (TIGR01451 family)/fimbrial isopeptide formation D2 family protein